MTLPTSARHRLPPSDPSRARDGDTASAIERTLTEQRAGARCPLLAGKWLTSIDSYTGKATEVLSGSATRNHLLGRQPEGFIVCDLDGSSAVYRTAWDSQTIALVVSGVGATIHYRVWVF